MIIGRLGRGLHLHFEKNGGAWCCGRPLHDTIDSTAEDVSCGQCLYLYRVSNNPVTKLLTSNKR